VKEIAEMNKNGNKPTDLGALKLMPVKETYEFTDVVGQTTLAALEKNPKKKKRKNKGNSRPQNN
jgi:hypothetical protein